MEKALKSETEQAKAGQLSPKASIKPLGTGRKVQEGIGWKNHDSVTLFLGAPPSFGYRKKYSRAHPLYLAHKKW